MGELIYSDIVASYPVRWLDIPIDAENALIGATAAGPTLASPQSTVAPPPSTRDHITLSPDADRETLATSGRRDVSFENLTQEKTDRSPSGLTAGGPFSTTSEESGNG